MQSATALYCLLPMKPPEHRTVFDHQADAFWSADQAPSRVNSMPLHPTRSTASYREPRHLCASLAGSEPRTILCAGRAG